MRVPASMMIEIAVCGRCGSENMVGVSTSRCAACGAVGDIRRVDYDDDSRWLAELSTGERVPWNEGLRRQGTKRVPRR